MDHKKYFNAFSIDELCTGAELLLSDEASTSFRKLDTGERRSLFPKPISSSEILELCADSKEYVENKRIDIHAKVWIDSGKKIVLRTLCSCNEYTKDYYGCAHTAAALTGWYFEKEGQESFIDTPLETGLKNLAKVEDPFEPGVMKRTDGRLLKFLKTGPSDNILPVWNSESIPKKELIHSDYSLFETNHSFYMEIKAGISRNYIIKDIPNFYRAYKAGDRYSFGKNELTLSENNCDSFTNALMKIVSQAMNAAGEHGINHYFKSNGTIISEKRYLCLDGYLFGELLKLLDGSALIFQDGTVLPVSLDRKGLEATLSHKKHGAVLTLKKLTIIAENSNRSLFLKDKHGVFSIVSDNPDVINTLRELITMSGSLYIRESDIFAMAQNILPVIEEYGKLTLQGINIDEYEHEKPVFELYLDIRDRSVIVCEPFSLYKNPESRFRLFDNTTGASIRNGIAENIFAQEMVNIFQEYDPAAGILSAHLEDDALYAFLQETIPVLQQKATVYVSEKLKNIKAKNLPKLQASIGIKPSGLLMSLKGGDLTDSELQDILSAYSSKKKFFRLKNGEFFNIDGADTQTWDTLADIYQHHGDNDPSLISVPMYRALYLYEMLKDREELSLETDSHYLKLVQTMQAEEQSSVPDTLKDILRPYQVEGYHWIRRLKSIGFGGILADDMGLGKTLQILAFLLSEKLNGKSGKDLRTLIVCPASLVYNWKKEIQKFTPELTCTVIAGAQSVRQELISSSESTDIWITSYDLLKRDITLYEDIAFANEIIDEAQFIKNQHTQASQSVRVISADFRMALTGTPIENHLGELWSIMDYLMPGFLYNYSRFQKDYESPIVNNQDEESLVRLRKLVHPFILRRLKHDVLKELPDKLEETIIVNLEGEQRKLYDAYASRLRISLAQKNDSEFRSSKIEVLAELTRLRQICCDPSLLVDNYHGESAKLDACIELVSQAVEGGHKVLLFSQFTSMLDIICKRLSESGFAYYRIDGSVSKERRMEMVDSFDYDEVPVFCISLKAGGTGLNLTAADIVIHYDPWWNQAAQNQATDRAHRIGQTNSVSVYELIAGDTIEEQIQNIKNDKSKLMEDVLSGDSISSSQIDRSELLQLLEMNS